MKRARTGTICLGLALVALVALSLAAAGGSTRKNGQLVIEDSELVSWMTINNTFNQDPGHTPWDGVLIQIGDYLDDGDPFNIFESVTFEDSKGTNLKTLDAGTFQWIDIVAVDTTRTAPMTSSHLSLLYPEPGTTSGCADYDACAIENCSCATPPCVSSGFNPLDRCLRLRSLHGSFTPYAVITYWQGSNGFGLTSEPLTLGTKSRVSFTFNDPVQIYVDGQLLNIGKIASIHVNSNGGTMHGASEDPPWYP